MKISHLILVALCGQHAAHAMHPLHQAAYDGNYQQVEALVRARADVNQFDGSKMTPLEWAVIKNHVDIVKLLLESNANPNQSAYQFYPPLVHAVSEHEGAIVNLLLDHHAYGFVFPDDGRNLVHLAAQNGYVDIVESFLNHGADVDCQNLKNGWTPLHYAADCRRLNVVQFLLEHHANHNLRSKDGSTALKLATRKCFTEVMALLAAWPKKLCANARLTLLMGLHPRVGAASILNVLSQPLIRMLAEEYILPQYY